MIFFDKRIVYNQIKGDFFEMGESENVGNEGEEIRSKSIEGFKLSVGQVESARDETVDNYTVIMNIVDREYENPSDIAQKYLQTRKAVFEKSQPLFRSTVKEIEQASAEPTKIVAYIAKHASELLEDSVDNKTLNEGFAKDQGIIGSALLRLAGELNESVLTTS